MTDLNVSKRAALVALALFFLASDTRARPPHHLRIVHYNIGLGKNFPISLGSVNQLPFERVTTEIEADPSLRSPDILVLQEFCHCEESSDAIVCARDNPDFARYRAFVVGDTQEEPPSSVERHAAFAVESAPRKDNYGACDRSTAIFSRHPIQAHGTFPLPRADEGRVAVWIDLVIEEQAIRIYSPHLENDIFGDIRHRQMLAVVDHWAETARDRRIFIVGDFNGGAGEPTAELLRGWAKTKPPESLVPSTRDAHPPTGILLSQVDWIYAPVPPRSQHTAVSPFWLWSSDHWPIAADYVLPLPAPRRKATENP